MTAPINGKLNSPQIIQLGGIQNDTENKEPKKPTIDNMNDLYSIFTKVPLKYKDAAIEKLNNYIQENNLDIDANNLQLFFMKVLKSGTEDINSMFNDYIENGYDPQKELLDKVQQERKLADEQISKYIDMIENEENTDSEHVKPTIDNMNDLYAIFTKVPLKYKDAAIEKLNNYIQENNLDIDANNLQSFFMKVLKSGTEDINSMFIDYIENGYDPVKELREKINSQWATVHGKLESIKDPDGKFDFNF